MNPGKQKCEILRNIRMDIAKKYGLKYNPTECTYEGECNGICPKCDSELQELQKQLNNQGITNIDLFKDIQLSDIEEINAIDNLETDILEGYIPLEGDIIELEGEPFIDYD